MQSRYHTEITRVSLESFFAPAPLREITRANVQQDSWPSMFGVEARRHVCDCTVSESMAYVDEEHATIAELAAHGGSPAQQRAALGRLLHTVQDFYAHTNYVALWLAHCTQRAQLDASSVLDPTLLAHPSLQIACWISWRDPLYYVPGVGNLLRRLWLPADSHEAINLDDPSRGANFHVAVAMAQQRTRVEYARAVAAVRERGGQDAVARFHGAAGYAARPTPAAA